MKTHAGRKLSRTTAHRKALLRNMATSLLKHERIKTTVSKGKEVVRFTDWLISEAKKQSLRSHRIIAAEISDRKVYQKLFDVLVPRYQGRQSGYARTFKLGYRLGDGAEMLLVKLIQ